MSKPVTLEENAPGGGGHSQVSAPASTGESAPADDSAVVRAGLPIVGLGVSAGGLGALEAFFEPTPANSGLAFVVSTHQRPEFRSRMAELLGRKASMPVTEVAGHVLDTLAVKQAEVQTEQGEGM